MPAINRPLPSKLVKVDFVYFSLNTHFGILIVVLISHNILVKKILLMSVNVASFQSKVQGNLAPFKHSKNRYFHKGSIQLSACSLCEFP